MNIELDFDKKYKIFESQRVDDYSKWLKNLIEQRDAYICFCQNHQKCIKDCFDSVENKSYNIEKDNSEVIYTRLKNPNRTFKYFDYMKAEDKEYDSTAFGDFVLYKNYNSIFSDSFKRVIDDHMFEVTHIIDNAKNIHCAKNNLLTNIFMFNNKKYIELPDVKVRHMDKFYPSISVKDLKTRHFLPETLINEAYLLGHSKGPEKEYKKLIENDKNKDLIGFGELIYEVRFYIKL
jgi:nondiscriminating glutamyl-tRNA synthetase